MIEQVEQVKFMAQAFKPEEQEKPKGPNLMGMTVARESFTEVQQLCFQMCNGAAKAFDGPADRYLKG